MTFKRYLLCAAILLCCGMTAFSQGTSCSQPGSFTTATDGATLDNRIPTTPGCNVLALEYYSKGFSALSIELQGAPDVNGSAGSFVTVASSFVTYGANPGITLQNVTTFNTYYPWLRVHVNSVTGTGTITYKLQGVNVSTLTASSGGGGINKASLSATVPIVYNVVTGNFSCPTCAVGAPLVTSVFARIGDVVATLGDYTTDLVTEGTNLYFTTARAHASFSGTSPISYNSTTGAISCPSCNTSSSNVISVFGRTGAVSATSGDYSASQVTNAFDTSANNSLGAHSINITDIGTPSVPGAATTQVYTKAGTLCSLSPGGFEYCTGTAQAASVAISAIANDTGTGTVANKLVRYTGAPSKVIIASAGDLDGIVGICIFGCGTSGNAVIVTSGTANCIFENATTAGNYVIPGTGTAGDCRDAGTSTALPVSTQGVQLVGIVLSTNVGAGTYTIQLLGGRTTTKYRSGIYLSSGTTGLVPASNDNISGVAAGTAVWNWTATGILIQPQGASGSTASGPLDVEGGSVGNALTTQGSNKIVGPSGPQNGNNSSSSGGVGGANTFTAGRGGGFTGGSSSTGGTGGVSSLIGGQGGDANSGSTNGTGGNAVVQAGAPGGGGGTAGVDGFVALKGHVQGNNLSGSTSVTGCGTSPTFVGTDIAGRAVEGSISTGCTISFARTWTATPYCVVQAEAGLTFSYTVSTTAITITNIGALSSTGIQYHCMQ